MTTQSKSVVLGAGTVLSIGGLTGATGTETFVAIGEISDAKFDGFKRATTKSDNFDSGTISQYLPTMLDYSTFTGTYNRISTNAGQLAMIAALQNGGSYDFKLQLTVEPLLSQTTTGDLITFSAIVTEAGSFDLSMTKVSSCSFSLQLNSYLFTAGT
jgi:hypothetical protein